jgi:capsular polysaccharide transport system permease protein
MSEFDERYQLQSSGVTGAGWRRTRGGYWSRLGRLTRFFDVWLWVFVFAPSLIAGVYYFFLASDLYLSEAKFIVRSAATAPSSGLGAMLQNSGLSGSSDYAYSVEDYILSRDAVRKLQSHDHLQAIFARPGADFVSRFPSFYGGQSFEALYKHYLGFVGVTFNGSTGVSTLSVKAYTREDAKAVATALLGYSEDLVNRLNARQLNDTVATMQEQVALAETRVGDTQHKLEAFRLSQQMIDPEIVAKNINDTQREMMTARTATQTQLTLLQTDSPGSPEIRYLQTRLSTLDQQIAAARRQSAGDFDSVATKLGDYEQLKLDRELAEKSLSSATTSLEQARLEAVRHQIYIDPVVEPNLPDYPLYPKRLISFLMVVAVCLVSYSTAWLLIAGVRDHAAD